jgi:hypothetical protein
MGSTLEGEAKQLVGDVERQHTEQLSLCVVYEMCNSAPVSTGNTFQDLMRLRETVDNVERNILRDIRVT